MGKKLSRRSLQDDAFTAEESINRRSRVMGQGFADAHADDSPLPVDDSDDDDSDSESTNETDPTEDPRSHVPDADGANPHY